MLDPLDMAIKLLSPSSPHTFLIQNLGGMTEDELGVISHDRGTRQLYQAPQTDQSYTPARGGSLGKHTPKGSKPRGGPA